MNLSVDWQVNRQEWERLFAMAEHSNLLQSWVYGDAKQSTESWKVQRAVIRSAGAPRALVQALRRPIARRLGLTRINRGPLWLGCPPDEREIVDVLHLLREPVRLWRGGLLSIAPELPAGEPFATILRGGGCWRLPVRPHTSLRIDLSLPLATLRSNLDKRWRKQLNKAERAGVVAITDTSKVCFDWLMARHGEMMRQRRFMSIPVDLLRHMRANSTTANELQVVVANLRGESVSALLVIRHGTTTTALVNWTGAEGRRTSANNFIHWQAIALAKAAGQRWFDFNHLDDRGLPGVALWKRRVAGIPYVLAGEFVCL
jgi:hypothetical protein